MNKLEKPEIFTKKEWIDFLSNIYSMTSDPNKLYDVQDIRDYIEEQYHSAISKRIVETLLESPVVQEMLKGFMDSINDLSLLDELGVYK